MNSQRPKDIQQFTKDFLGYDIDPYQIKVVMAILEGKQMGSFRQAGRMIARRIALAYIQKYGVEI